MTWLPLYIASLLPSKSSSVMTDIWTVFVHKKFFSPLSHQIQSLHLALMKIAGDDRDNLSFYN